ncbi:threonine ammonia-lyase [Aliidongia dinghuensis]|uniref:Threonine ammonia-lyase n=1 Tax=Aliidongia dinghuensis TaxID=1867774 RepID=A0A8J2Z0P3_9PROT|nr:threonine ammonia-lyase [Aliidongia dinghuensis]
MDPAKSLPTLADVRDAAETIRTAVLRTPSVPALALSAALGLDVVLKLETLQRTGAFKERGALYKLASLNPDERRRGVIAMSAGNHAQGVAYHAQRLGIPATIVMPLGTPFTKIERTAGYGARVLLRGESLTEARQAAYELAAADKLVFVHPYDDLRIIAGQGTIALEMLADDPDLDVLIVPIGGGGMIGGVALAAKALKPAIRVVGVQSASFPAMHHVLHGLAVPASGQTVAEGIAVREPGKLTEAIVRQCVDEIVLVEEDTIERAIEMLLTQQKLVAEGAGAAGIAALLADPEPYKGQKIGVVLCGGNIDARILASILMRGMVRSGRLVRLRAEISDSPGTLAKVARIIGEAGGNIVEIFHQRLFHDVPVKLADLDVVVETRDIAHVREILAKMDEGGFKTRLLSNSALESGL